MFYVEKNQKNPAKKPRFGLLPFVCFFLFLVLATACSEEFDEEDNIDLPPKNVEVENGPRAKNYDDWPVNFNPGADTSTDTFSLSQTFVADMSVDATISSFFNFPDFLSFKLTNNSATTTHCNVYVGIKVRSIHKTEHAVGEYGFNTSYAPSCILRGGGTGYAFFRGSSFSPGVETATELRNALELISIHTETDQHYSMGEGIKPVSINVTTTGARQRDVRAVLTNRNPRTLFACKTIGGILGLNAADQVVGFQSLYGTIHVPQDTFSLRNGESVTANATIFFNDTVTRLRVYTIYNPVGCTK